MAYRGTLARRAGCGSRQCFSRDAMGVWVLGGRTEVSEQTSVARRGGTSVPPAVVLEELDLVGDGTAWE